jgi:hypothetical protein
MIKTQPILFEVGQNTNNQGFFQILQVTPQMKILNIDKH